MPDRDDDALYNAKQDAYQILLSGATPKQAAAVVGVSERTIFRWMESDKLVRAQMLKQRQLTLEATSLKLSEIGLEAVGVLRDIMNDEAAPKGTRVKAADAVLLRMVLLDEHASMGHRLLDIEKRLGLLNDVQSALVDTLPNAQSLLLVSDSNNIEETNGATFPEEPHYPGK